LAQLQKEIQMEKKYEKDSLGVYVVFVKAIIENRISPPAVSINFNITSLVL